MSRLWVISGAVSLTILLLAGIVGTLLEKNKPLGQGELQAVVQSFLRAIEAEDFLLAHRFLAKTLRQECAIDDLFASGCMPEARLENQRVTHDNTTFLAETAFVTVRVTHFRGSGPFGTSESSFEQRYTLRQEDGQWRFARYPWPLLQCSLTKPFPSESAHRSLVEPRPQRASKLVPPFQAES